MIDKSDTKKVSIRKIIEDLKVGVAYIPDGVDYHISTTDINRPGMQLNGYYDHFPDDRNTGHGKGGIFILSFTRRRNEKRAYG